MKQIKYGRWLWFVWLIYWLSYNTYFGWNMYAESELEKKFDSISSLILIFVVVLLFWRLFDLYKDAVEKWERKQRFRNLDS